MPNLGKRNEHISKETIVDNFLERGHKLGEVFWKDDH